MILRCKASYNPPVLSNQIKSNQIESIFSCFTLYWCYITTVTVTVTVTVTIVVVVVVAAVVVFDNYIPMQRIQ